MASPAEEGPASAPPTDLDDEDLVNTEGNTDATAPAAAATEAPMTDLLLLDRSTDDASGITAAASGITAVASDVTATDSDVTAAAAPATVSW